MTPREQAAILRSLADVFRTSEHIEDWRNYKALRDGGHIRLATAEEIQAADAAAKAASKGGKA